MEKKYFQELSFIIKRDLTEWLKNEPCDVTKWEKWGEVGEEKEIDILTSHG